MVLAGAGATNRMVERGAAGPRRAIPCTPHRMKTCSVAAPGTVPRRRLAWLRSAPLQSTVATATFSRIAASISYSTYSPARASTSFSTIPMSYPCQRNPLTWSFPDRCWSIARNSGASFRKLRGSLKPEGVLFMIAQSAGPIHRYPVDCYRFYPDAYQALADWSGLRLEDCWMDERGPWRDWSASSRKGAFDQYNPTVGGLIDRVDIPLPINLPRRSMAVSPTEEALKAALHPPRR